MDDVWIDAVDQFLRGNQWKKRVVDFVDKNCILFADEDDEITAFSHGQFDIWQEFKDTVEDSIGGVLNDLGGSPEAFSKACDERLAKEDKGPRDAAVKDILRKLLTYDSFEDFGFMMKLRCKEIENNEVCDADYLSSTLQREKDNENAKNMHSYEGKNSVDAQSLAYGGTTQVDVKDDSTAAEGAGEDEDDEKVEQLRRELQRKEWEIQLEIAKSILQDDDAGKSDAGKKEPELVAWARGVVYMDKLLLPGSGASGQDISEHRRTLSILRNKVDLMVARNMLQENDNTREKLLATRNEMESQESKMSMGSLVEFDERNLNELITLHAEKQNDVNVQRSSCTSYFEDNRISQETYSDVYFFLKDMIKQNNTFIFEQDEVHDFIFKRVGHEQMSLVPELLKLLVLEDEELWLQEHIRKLVSEDAGGKSQTAIASDDMKSELAQSEVDMTSQAVIKEQEELLRQIKMEKQLAVENAEKIVTKERSDKKVMESKMREMELEKEELKKKMSTLISKSEAEEVARKAEQDIEKRVEAEVQARMKEYERQQEKHRVELEEERRRVEEEAVALENKLQHLEHQKTVATKKEEQIRALQKKATEVARAALKKKRELDNYNKEAEAAETKRLEDEAHRAEERKLKLEQEKKKLVEMKEKRKLEETKLRKEQEKRKILKENIQKEIETTRKKHFENHEHKTKRLQEEFEHKARKHVEAQRREVAAMKSKLQERLKAKNMKRKQKNMEDQVAQTADTADTGAPDKAVDAEMRSTLNKAKIKELSKAFNDKAGIAVGSSKTNEIVNLDLESKPRVSIFMLDYTIHRKAN